MSDMIDRRFGELAVARGFLAAPTLTAENARRAERSAAVPLEQWLRERGLLTPAQCAEVARAYQDEVRAKRKTEVPAPKTGNGGGAGAPQMGRYRLLAELGRGGMGVVYRAYDTLLKREVALKTVRVVEGGVTNLVDRLMREARTAAALEHPGIVPIHDIGVADGVPYIAMAFVRGKNYDTLLAEGAYPGLRERVAVLLAGAQAVAHAHDRQVVHRDLKPANLRIDEEGRVRVMDLGLAKSLSDVEPLTDTGEVLGTPRYMAPERLDGSNANWGPACDVYSLGVMLYEAMTNRFPYDGANLIELLSKVLAGTPTPPHEIDAHAPRDLERICLKAIARTPGERHPTAKEFAADLEAWLAGGRPPGVRTERRRRSWLSRWGWLLGVLAAAGLLALGIALGKGAR